MRRTDVEVSVCESGSDIGGGVRRTGWLAVTGLLLAVLAVPVFGPVLGLPTAAAEESRRVIARVHTDAVAVFVDDTGSEPRLTLGSKADVDGVPGKRFEADHVLFHVEDNLRRQIPANPSYAFLGESGDWIWLAPMTWQPDVLWPGFNTESIPAGVLDGNQVALTLESVSGPGNFHLYSIDVEGEPEHLLQVGGPAWVLAYNQHVHANWAFSEPGRYVLRVRADAAIAGTPVTDTADYVFHVGELDLATPTTLAVAVPQVRFGRAADLVARITPEAATGAVSVRVGSKTVTSSLSAGKARLKLPARSLKPGEHHLEIRYAGVAGIYAPTVAPVTVHVVKAKPTVRAKAPDTASRGSRVTLTVTVTAPGLKPAGKAKVKIAGLKAKTVKVLGGRASVTFTIAKSAKKSTRNVAVSYLGTKEIAKGDAKKLKLKIR